MSEPSHRWRKIAFFLVSCGVLFCVGCGPDLEAARAEFEKSKPGCRVIDIGVGEGDAEHAYVIINYKCGKDSSVRKEERLYTNYAGEWKRQ